jgi:hypothetical protein
MSEKKIQEKPITKKSLKKITSFTRRTYLGEYRNYFKRKEKKMMIIRFGVTSIANFICWFGILGAIFNNVRSLMKMWLQD